MMVLPSDAVVLLTGGTGFLGRYCLARLGQEPCEVHAVNRPGSGPEFGRIVWHSADLTVAEEAFALVRRVRPTHLLHSAWIAAPGRFWTDPDNIDWLQGGIALLRGFGEVGGQRFVGVGTCAEYAWDSEVLCEDYTPIRPSTLYGKAKAAMAAAVEAYSANYSFSFAWARLFQPYGPGDAPERLVSLVIDALRANRRVALTRGAQVRDFIFAPDVADLLVRLLADDRSGAFNVGTGKGVPVRTVVELLADSFGRRDLLNFGALQEKEGEPDGLVADMSKVSRHFAWSPKFSLEAGLAQTVKYALNPEQIL